MVFTQLVKVVAGILRQLNVQIFVYLDDWLVVGNTEHETHWAIDVTQNLTAELGYHGRAV